jgi:replication factor C large subunit
MPVPWVTKHRPRHLKEIVGNEEAQKSFLKWLESWGRTSRQGKAALLYGPAGTGKTVTVEAAARDLGYDLIEINASDKRTGDALEKIAGLAATQGGLFGKKRIILLDEVDGINLNEDRGAVAALGSIIQKTSSPIVLTANDPWDPKIRPIRNSCELFEFKRLSVRDCLPHLKKIAAIEGLEVDEKALKFIVERNEGDMRSIMNDLESFSGGRKRLVYDDVSSLGYRDRKENVFGALSMIFNAKNASWARKAVDVADIDYEMLFEWIYENLPSQLRDPEDLANGMDALAKADIYFARIRRNQEWSLLPFALDMMTAGVAVSKERTKPAWVPNKFPQRVSYLSRTRKDRMNKKAIGEKIARRCHLSVTASLRQQLPYVQFIFQKNPTMAAKMATYFGFDEDMVSYLAGTEKRTSRIISLLESSE